MGAAYENFSATTLPPLPEDTAEESAKMITWLANQAASVPKGAIVIGVQHIPIFRNGTFPGSKPYWIISDPYRTREMTQLTKIGVKHMLVGHWHNFRVFLSNGITWHEGASTSGLPFGGQLGFAVHVISLTGNVQSRFVAIPGATP